MTMRYPYTLEIVAFSVLTLLAAGLTWVSLTAPEGHQKGALTGIILLVVSPLFVWQGIRRKQTLRIDSFEGKPWYWFGLSCFWLLLAFLPMDTLRSVQILMFFIFLVLAAFTLSMAITLKWPNPRSFEND